MSLQKRNRRNRTEKFGLKYTKGPMRGQSAATAAAATCRAAGAVGRLPWARESGCGVGIDQ